jgi:putative transposase
LASKDELKELKAPGIRLDRILHNNLCDEVELLSFALMPNHFHFILKQKTTTGMQKFMKRLLTAYSIYFNSKYKRVGPLFQGIYKAVLISNDQYLLHLSRYIHLNPLKCYPPLRTIYSSYQCYLGTNRISWLKPEDILVHFKTAQTREYQDILSYQSFVEDYLFDSKEILKDLVLEDD